MSLKNLKIFNTEEEYNNYITGSTAEIPNVSVVGIDSNVKFNPTKMFIITGKKTLVPNTTKIPFIVNTVTEGKVNVWYRQSTGNTYTKLNNNDITFPGGNLQNKIVDYTSVNAQLPSTGYNNVYIISGVSTTNSSIKDSIECIQYGTIELDSTSFVATGETKTVRLKTAIGNAWKITNIPNWLTFSTTSGIGPTLISITANTYEETASARTANVTLTYTKKQLKNYETTTTFIQEAADAKYMYLISEGTTSASTEFLSSAGTSESIAVITNLTQSEINNLITTSIDGSWITNVVVTTTGVTFNVAPRDIEWEGSERTGTITIHGGGSGDLTITVNQSENETYYLTFNSPVTISSGAVNDYTINCSTNCSLEILQSLTYTTSQNWVSDIKPSSVSTFTFDAEENNNQLSRVCTVNVFYGTRNVTYFTVNQLAAEVKYFIFDSTGTDTISKNFVSKDAAPQSLAYTTNYTNLTTLSNEWINGSISGSNILVSVLNNTSLSSRTGNVYVISNNTTIGTVNVTQNADSAYLTFSDGSTEPRAIIVDSGVTSNYFDILTNIPSEDLVIVCDGMITGQTFNNNRITLTFNANATTSNRNGTCVISYKNLSLEYSITQMAIPYLKFSDSSSTKTVTVGSAATSGYFDIITNISTNQLVIENDGIITASTLNNKRVTLSFEANSSTSTVTGNCSVSYDNLKISYNVVQEAKAYLTFDDGTTASTVNVSSSETSSYFDILTNIPSEDLVIVCDGMITGQTFNNNRVTLTFDVNTTASNKTGECTISHDNFSIVYSITQTGSAYLTFRDGSTEPRISEVGSAVTSDYFDILTNVSISQLTLTNDGIVTGSSINGNRVTLLFDINESTSAVTGSCTVSYLNLSLIYEINQEAIPYLMFDDGSTEPKIVTVDSGITSAYFDISTNIRPNQLTIVKNGMFTGATLNNNRVTLAFDANTTTSSRNGTCMISYNSLNLIYQVTQKAKTYLTFSNGTTAQTTNVSSAGTSSVAVLINTNYSSNSDLSISSNKTWLTGNVNTGAIDYLVTANPAGSAARSGILTVSGRNGEIIILTINQSSGAVVTRNVTIIFPDELNVKINNLPSSLIGEVATIYLSKEDGETTDGWEGNLNETKITFTNRGKHQIQITVPLETTSEEFSFIYETNGGSGTITGYGWLSDIQDAPFDSSGGSEQPFHISIPANESIITLDKLLLNLIINYS